MSGWLCRACGSLWAEFKLSQHMSIALRSTKLVRLRSLALRLCLLRVMVRMLRKWSGETIIDVPTNFNEYDASFAA